jgi:hypothetical protein
MILQKSRNKVSPGKEAYLIINIVFAGVILLVMLYSGFFSPVRDNYPVTCVHEKLTGEPCASCGLSHSFSLIVRGNFREAAEWNVYGLRVFLFFALQLVLRTGFSMFYIKYPQTRSQLIVVDSIGSGIMFLIAFWPFMRWVIGNAF